jgi:hypothetical protein
MRPALDQPPRKSEQLAPSELGKHAGSSAQLLESSGLDNPSGHQNDDAVDMLNRAETMRNNDAGHVELGERGAHDRLSLVVERARRLVEQENAGAAKARGIMSRCRWPPADQAPSEHHNQGQADGQDGRPVEGPRYPNQLIELLGRQEALNRGPLERFCPTFCSCSHHESTTIEPLLQLSRDGLCRSRRPTGLCYAPIRRRPEGGKSLG